MGKLSAKHFTRSSSLADSNFDKVKTFIWRVHSVDIISAYGSVLSPSSSSCSPADRKTVQQQSCFLVVVVVVVVVAVVVLVGKSTCAGLTIMF